MPDVHDYFLAVRRVELSVISRHIVACLPALHLFATFLISPALNMFSTVITHEVGEAERAC